jgi:repressor of nif and glnA expression
MAQSKTWSQRILNAASKETTVDNSTLRVRFRIPKTEMSQESFNNSIGRTMRYMAEIKLVKKVGVGEYQITKKGVKALVA